MSTIIRLSIVGKIHQHTYRIVAQDKRSKRDGKFLEILGNVNPHLETSKQVTIKKDRVAFWQKNGAQLSPTVKHLLEKGKLPPRPKKVRETKDKAPQAQPETAKTEEAQTAPQNQDSPPEPEQPAEAEKPAEESQPTEPTKEEKTE